MQCVKLIEDNGAIALSFLGANSSGKGTLAKLVEILLQLLQFKVSRIVTSDVIKKYLDESNTSDLAQRLRENRDRLKKAARDGVITANYDDNLICEMMDLEISAAVQAGAKYVILDGFLRTPGQMKQFIACGSLFVVFLTAEKPYVLAKAAERVAKAKRRGEKPRDDDAPWAVEERYEIFRSDTMAALKIYRDSHARKVLAISCMRFLPTKASMVLQEIGISGEIRRGVMAYIDDKTSEAGKFVEEVEFGGSPNQGNSQNLAAA